MTATAVFFEELQAAFARLEQARPALRRLINVAGCGIELRFAGQALQAALWPALAHLEAVDPGAPPEFTFCLWDTAASGILPPPPPFSNQDYHRYGQRAIADDGERAILYSPGDRLLCAYDHSTRQGYFWTCAAEALSIYERAAPLQTLFHWALHPLGWQVVHAAALGDEAGGVLLVGGSGAGKSTTALACLQQPGLRYLCDDKCLVSLDPTPRAFGVFSSAKLKADMLARLPHFAPLVAGWDGAYKVGKSLVYLYPAYRERMVTAFPIRAILIARIARQARPALRPAALPEVFKVLGPSTVIWLPGAEADCFHFITSLVRRLPCYWLDLALDPLDNMAMLSQAVEEHTL